ncbi:MAG: hypothetical protein AAF950_15700 [Pseudomonadota bacterium]
MARKVDSVIAMKFAEMTREAKIEWLLMEAYSDWSSFDLLIRSSNDYIELNTEERWSAYQTLSSMSDEELDEFLANRVSYRSQDAQRRQQQKDSFLFFSKPAAHADFGFWARQLLWTVEQALALSLGRNPDIVNSTTLAAQEEACKGSPFAREYRARVRIADTFLVAGQLSSEATPGEMIAWFDRVRLSVPNALVDAVAEIGHQIADWFSEYKRVAQELGVERDRLVELERLNKLWEEGCLNLISQHSEEMGSLQNELDEIKRERDELRHQLCELEVRMSEKPKYTKGIDLRRHHSALVIIDGMATEKFGYSDDSQRGRSAVSNITSAIEIAGHQISEKTVRSVLDDARNIKGNRRK